MFSSHCLTSIRCFYIPITILQSIPQCIFSWVKHIIYQSNIWQSGLEKNVFGNHIVPPPASGNRGPPAFASDPLIQISPAEDTEGGASSVNSDKDSRPTISVQATDAKYLDEVCNSIVGVGSSMVTESEIVELDGPNALEHQIMQDQDPHFTKTVSLMSLTLI